MFGGELLESVMSGDLYFYGEPVDAEVFGPRSHLVTKEIDVLLSVFFSFAIPEARYRHSAVIDPTARAMYIFAGMSLGGAGTANTFGDLHRYDVDLDSWTELQGTAGRSRHTAVWDSSSDRMIVFGGVDSMLNKMGDVLEYDRSSDSWSFPQVEGPAARDGHVAVWDDATGTMLMCCGVTSDSGESWGDLWSYDGKWAKLSPSGGITARRYTSAVWDPQARAMLGFGGRETPEAALNSLFLYSTSTNSWSEYTVSGAPAQDTGATAWDPVNSHLYAFGGLDQQGPLDSLWRLDATHTSITSTATSITHTATSTTSSSFSETSSSATTSTKAYPSTSTKTWAPLTTTWTKYFPTQSTTRKQSPTDTAELLGDLGNSEGELARQLVATLGSGNSSNSSGILGRALTQSHLATIQTLALDSLAISDMSHNVTVQSASASVEIPPDVVAQAAAAGGSGLVLLSVSVGLAELGTGLNDSEGGAGHALVSRPVSITFRGLDGNRIPMPSLARPIEVLIVGATEGSWCAFWDEERRYPDMRLSLTLNFFKEDTGTWSSEGLRAVSFRVFGAVLETFLQVLRCSTAAQVFSAEGFENLSKGTPRG
ncbi:ATRN [Symbiodinium natans]|uniref:ATRN protein n=1 Tax=Symbiodinium natans TaxID=878477 RepID=A0A812IHK9_9DINO|nr:ATRN [Symbiodinium natans]